MRWRRTCLIDRASEDVDLFTNRLDLAEFSRALEVITNAYRQAGYEVYVVLRAELFARLLVGDEDPVRVELAYDWRGKGPALLDIGSTSAPSSIGTTPLRERCSPCGPRPST